MMINLRAKSKLGFVIGICERNSYGPDLQEQWEKCNTFVLAWIMNTVSKELLSGIVYALDASMVWADLQERFDKVDGSSIYQFHRDICTIHQGNSLVSAYFTKLRLMWDEFDVIVPPPSWNCDRSRSYVDHIQYLRLSSFLIGLNDMYGHVRSQILMMSPFPSVGKAYVMIISDKSQRVNLGMRTGGDIIEATTLYVGRGNYSRNTRVEYNPRSNDTDKTGVGIKKVNWNLFCDHCECGWNLFCDHCEMYSHTEKNCFRII